MSVRISGDTSALTSSLADAKSQAQSAASEIEKPMTMQVDSAGASAGIGDIVAGILSAQIITEAFNAAVQAVTESLAAWSAFTSQNTELAQMLQMNADGVGKVNDQLRTQSDLSGTGTATLQSYAEAAGALGAHSVDAVSKATDSMNTYAIATGSTQAQTIALYTSLGRVYGYNSDQSAEYGNALVALTNKYGIQSTAIADVVTQTANMNKMMGESPEKSAAFATAIMAAGGDASQAMSSAYADTQAMAVKMGTLEDAADKTTTIKGKTSKGVLITPDQIIPTDAAEIAKGKLDQIQQVFGESGAQLAQDMGNDYQATMQKMAVALHANTTLSTADKSELLKDLGLRQQNASTILKMADNTDTYSAALATVNENSKDTTATQTLFNKQMEELDNQEAIASARTTDMGNGLGQILEPALRAGISAFNDFAWQVKAVESAIAGGDWGSVGDIITKALEGAFDSISKFDFGGLISGIETGIKGALEALSQVGDWISQKLSGIDWGKVWGDLSGIGAGLLSAIQNALNQIPNAINAATNLNLGEKLGNALFGAIDFGVTTATNVVNAVIKMLQGVDWSSIGSSYVGYAVKMWDGLYTATQNWITGGGPTKIGDEIGTSLSGVLSGLGWVAGKLYDAISNYISAHGGFWQVVENAFGTLADWGKLAMEIAEGIGQGIYDKIQMPIAQVHDFFATTMASVVSGFVGAGIDMGNAIVSGLNAAEATIKGILTGWYDAAVNVYNYITGHASSTASNQASVDAETEQELNAAHTQTVGSSSSNIGTAINNAQINDALSQMLATGALGSVGKSSNTGITTQTIGSGSTGTWNENTQQFEYPSGQPVVFANENANTKDTSTSGSTWNDNTQQFETPSGKAATFPNEGTNTPVDSSDNLSKILGTFFAGTLVDTKTKNDAMTAAYTSTLNAAGGLWADKLKAQQTADTTSATSVTTAAEAFKGGVTDATLTFKQGVDGASTGFFNTSQAINAASAAAAAQTGQTQVQYSGYAATALQLGAQIGGNFISNGGQAVAIGLTSTGQNIAVIGQVAQANAIAGGQVLTTGIGTAATGFGTSMGLTSAQFKAQMVAGGDSWMQSGKSAGAYNLSGASQGATATVAGGTSAGGSMTSGGTAALNGMTTGTNTFTTGAGQVYNSFSSLAGTINQVSLNFKQGVDGAFTGFFDSGGSSSNGGGTTSVNANGAIINPDGSANYTTVTCLGDTVLVNALKYTSPSGVVSYANPLNGDQTGSLYSGSSSSSDSYSWAGENDASSWGAKGALIDQPSNIIAGEKGRELLLPNNITETIMGLVAEHNSGNLNMNPEGKLSVEVINKIYLDGNEVTNMLMENATQELRRGGLHTH